jgi:hypothetical protein
LLRFAKANTPTGVISLKMEREDGVVGAHDLLLVVLVVPD